MGKNKQKKGEIRDRVVKDHSYRSKEVKQSIALGCLIGSQRRNPKESNRMNILTYN